MADKGGDRPGKTKGVAPGTVRRSGRRQGGDPPPEPPCWTFDLVNQTPEARQVLEGHPVGGAPKEGRIEVLSTINGPLGYAPADVARRIVNRVGRGGLKDLEGSVVRGGPKVRVKLCLGAT